MSMIEAYKKLRDDTLDQLETFRRAQSTLRINDEGPSRPPRPLVDAVNALLRSSDFAALFVAELNQKLANAHRYAMSEAEGFKESTPATVESLKLEKVRAVAMTAGEG
jgi:hypothetical protein